MRGEHHRRATARRLPDHVLQHPLVDRIQAREGLVEQQQPRRIDQGGRQLDLLRHALGQLADRRGGPLLEPQAVDQGARRLARLARLHPLQPTEVDHRVEHGHQPIEASLLGQEADLGGVLTRRRLAQHLDAPRGRAQQVERHAQGRGLAGAVAAEETEHPALRYGEAQAVHRSEVAETLGDLIKDEDGAAHDAASVRQISTGLMASPRMVLSRQSRAGRSSYKCREQTP